MLCVCVWGGGGGRGGDSKAINHPNTNLSYILAIRISPLPFLRLILVVEA